MVIWDFCNFVICDVIDVIVEMDLLLRPGWYILVLDTMEMINKRGPILHSLHWSRTFNKDQFFVRFR